MLPSTGTWYIIIQSISTQTDRTQSIMYCTSKYYFVYVSVTSEHAVFRAPRSWRVRVPTNGLRLQYLDSAAFLRRSCYFVLLPYSSWWWLWWWYSGESFGYLEVILWTANWCVIFHTGCSTHSVILRNGYPTRPHNNINNVRGEGGGWLPVTVCGIRVINSWIPVQYGTAWISMVWETNR